MSKFIDRKTLAGRKEQNAIKRRLERERQKRCEICGTATNKLEMHHKNRVIDGGSDDDDNLMLLCHDCHRKIHGNHRGR